MSRGRLFLMGILAVMSIGAVASASASAAEWLVEGKTFSGTEEISGANVGNVTLLTTVNGIHLVIVCTSATGKGTIKDPNTGSVPSGVAFTGCTVSEPSGCKTTNKTTTALEVSLLAEGEKRLITFFPSAAGEKKLFVTVEITGCSLEGEYEVTGGSVACEVVEPFVPAELKHCKFEPGVDQKLKFGTHEADFEGEFSFILVSKKKLSSS